MPGGCPAFSFSCAGDPVSSPFRLAGSAEARRGSPPFGAIAYRRTPEYPRMLMDARAGLECSGIPAMVH